MFVTTLGTAGGGWRPSCSNFCVSDILLFLLFIFNPEYFRNNGERKTENVCM